MEDRLMRLGTLCTHSFKAHLDRVTLQTGRKTERLWIDYPEAVAILPVVLPEKILLVRQYRYAVAKETLEIPAGKMDPNESPENAASRELFEETGFKAESLELILRYYPAYGYSNEVINLFIARNVSKEGDFSAVHEISKLEILSRREISDLVRSGKIQDAKTILAVNLLETQVKIKE